MRGIPARSRRRSVIAWLVAGLGVTLGVTATASEAETAGETTSTAATATATATAASGDGEVGEREALPPGDYVDLIALAWEKSKVRAYTEESLTLLADFGPADVNELNTEFGLSVGFPVARALSLRVSAAGRGWFYGYDGDRSDLSADLGGGKLFEELYGAEFGLGGVYGLSERWSIFGEGRGKLSGEPGADVGDATKGSGAVGVGFEYDERLKLALGVEVSSRIGEGGVSVQPVFSFRWKIREGMRLETNGIGLLLGLDLAPELELQLRGRYESDTFMLDDRGAALGEPTLREHRAPLLVALRWNPTEHWRLAAGLGSVVYQKWRVEAEQGGQKYSVHAGPAALGWLKLEYRF